LALLRDAADLPAALGTRLLQPKILELLQVFFLIARAYDAGAATYEDVAEMLQHSSSKALSSEAAQLVVQLFPSFPRSKSTICRKLRELEAELDIPLVHQLREGLACDGLTEHGSAWPNYFEANVLKLRRTVEPWRTAWTTGAQSIQNLPSTLGTIAGSTRLMAREEPEIPYVDYTSIHFPSDQLTIGAFKRLNPNLFNSDGPAPPAVISLPI